MLQLWFLAILICRISTGPNNHARNDGVHNVLLECFLNLGLTQCVHEPSRINSDNILDIIMCNDPLMVNFDRIKEPISTSDHCVLDFTLFLHPAAMVYDVDPDPISAASTSYCAPISLPIHDWAASNLMKLILIWQALTGMLYLDFTSMQIRFGLTLKISYGQWLKCMYRFVGNSQFHIHNATCSILAGRQEANGTLLTINGNPLATSSFTKDLGVVIDPDLKFDLHINDLVARAKQRAAIIHRCFISRNTGNLIRAFKTYVRPMLEYASQTWSPYLTHQNDLIESVQRSFT